MFVSVLYRRLEPDPTGCYADFKKYFKVFVNDSFKRDNIIWEVAIVINMRFWSESRRIHKSEYRKKLNNAKFFLGVKIRRPAKSYSTYFWRCS